jgi:hypothetical protein
MTAALEETALFASISKGTRNSLQEAWRLAGTLSDDEIKLRSTETRGTYLHQIALVARDVFRRYHTTDVLLPLVYRLALRGINVNAQNNHGNTCLHLACIVPDASGLCEHFIRIGSTVFVV